MQESFNQDFELWFGKVCEEMNILTPLLQSEMSDDVNILEGQLRTLESWSFRLIKIYCEAERFLSIAKAREVVSKSKDHSEMDREIWLENDVKNEKYIYKLLQYLVGTRQQSGIIARRISLGQSFLANHRQLDKNLQNPEGKGI